MHESVVVLDEFAVIRAAGSSNHRPDGRGEAGWIMPEYQCAKWLTKQVNAHSDHPRIFRNIVHE
jgi:hypothetical protein